MQKSVKKIALHSRSAVLYSSCKDLWKARPSKVRGTESWAKAILFHWGVLTRRTRKTETAEMETVSVHCKVKTGKAQSWDPAPLKENYRLEERNRRPESSGGLEKLKRRRLILKNPHTCYQPQAGYNDDCRKAGLQNYSRVWRARSSEAPEIFAPEKWPIKIALETKLAAA